MPTPQPELADRLAYFIVKVRRRATSPSGDFSGVVERLGSGEKRQFKSRDELVRLVDEWTR